MILRRFFLEKMTWIRTLIPPDTPLYKQKTEKKLTVTGFEPQAFGLVTQDYTTELRSAI